MKFLPIALHGIPHLSYLLNPLNLIFKAFKFELENSGQPRQPAPIHLSPRTYFRLLPVDSTQPLLSLCVCVVLLSFIVFSTRQHGKRENMK